MNKTSFSILSIKPKTLETEGTISTFFIKTLHYDSCCVPDVVYLHDLQMSIVNIFRWSNQIWICKWRKSWILNNIQIFQVCTKHARLDHIPTTFPCSKCWQVIDPSHETTTKKLNNKIGETLCEGLKWMSKLSEIDEKNTFEYLWFS